ncbi:DUF4440 domain-containing protein [uncultured Ruegeria sp.]|uniref:YybH family protein n=1 Tax=uncultured Ruegeria sp. TaxID=259304 RepID=UPI002624E21A|nr:DUF4440 domain-containing protein [uncultured Ruegeria sp.]
MDDIEAIKLVLNEWLDGLDSGDLERMEKTCDPEVVVCNEYQPTTIGIQAIRDKYGPRIEANSFSSTFDIEHLKVYGDMALLVGRFTVAVSNKSSGETGSGQGRIALIYRRHPDGSWKMQLDIDNNDQRDAA